MLEFTLGELLSTSKIRHSNLAKNPVRRISKHLDGLGPSLGWNDGVREVPFERTLMMQQLNSARHRFLSQRSWT